MLGYSVFGNYGKTARPENLFKQLHGEVEIAIVWGPSPAIFLRDKRNHLSWLQFQLTKALQTCH